MVRTLLQVGANPNLNNPYMMAGSPLILAVQKRKSHPAILKFLRDYTPCIDIYVGHIRCLKVRRFAFYTAFSYAEGDAQFILSLLVLNPALTMLQEKEISVKIAEASKFKKPFIVNDALCNTIGKWYSEANDPKNKLAIEQEVSRKCYHPIGNIVSSYLFFATKPVMLETLEYCHSTYTFMRKKEI